MKWMLLPFSYLFAAGIWLRNKLFDTGIKKSAEFEVPVIVVGNLRVGGTGKTPHTEWLINQLQHDYKVGMLSRGYGRRTKGFRWVEANDIAANCGDEPLQVKRKFPGVAVAVCEDRTAAIPGMLAEHDLDVIILDDAFQHRYVKPSMAIVLSAIDKPFFEDEYMPAGRLREKGEALKRADVLIYTKVALAPTAEQAGHVMGRTLSVTQKETFIHQAKKYNPAIDVYFSGYKYGELIDLRTGLAIPAPPDNVVLVTGIADAAGFVTEANKEFKVVKHFSYPDHFNYTTYYTKQWVQFIKTSGMSAVIVTTEKDGIRLKPLLKELEEVNIYYLPIEVEIPDDNGADLINKVKHLIVEKALASANNKD